MSAQCYEHRLGYCTNAKTCFNVHIGAILAERRVLVGSESNIHCVSDNGATFIFCIIIIIIIFIIIMVTHRAPLTGAQRRRNTSCCNVTILTVSDFVAKM